MSNPDVQRRHVSSPRIEEGRWRLQARQRRQGGLTGGHRRPQSPSRTREVALPLPAALTRVRQGAVASVAAYVVQAGPLVQTRVRSTFVDIHLTVVACRQTKGKKPKPVKRSVASSSSQMLSNPFSSKHGTPQKLPSSPPEHLFARFHDKSQTHTESVSKGQCLIGQQR